MAVKALFLGLGGVGQRHLRNLRTLVPSAAIAAVRTLGRRFEIRPDLSADQTIDIVDKYGIALFPDIDMAVRDFNPDFAIVASPSSAHAAQVIRLMELGVPVLLEKPICINEVELENMLAAQAAHNVPVQVGYMLRFHPAVARLRALVASGELGRPLSVRAEAHSYLPSWHPYEKVSDFYAGRADLGGGVILTEIHLLDLLTDMFGCPIRLWSVGGALSSLNLPVEDTVSTLMEFEHDNRPLPVTLAVSFVQKPPQAHVAIRCEDGVVTWSLAENSQIVDNLRLGTRETFSCQGFDRNSMFVDELRHFLTCLSGEEEPRAALADVAVGQRVALAMQRSLRQKAMVELSCGDAI